MDTQPITLPRQPTKLEKAALILGRTMFWIGLFLLMILLFINAGTAQALLNNLKNVPGIGGNQSILTVTTKHLPADIYIDDQPYPTTPTQVTLIPSDYVVKLVPKGPRVAAPLQIPLHVPQNSFVTLHAQVGPELLFSSYWIVYSYPATNGTYLIVYSQPIGAKVILDDSEVSTTPAIIYNLTPKRSTIEITHPNYEPLTLPVNLTPNTVTVIRANLYRQLIKP